MRNRYFEEFRTRVEAKGGVVVEEGWLGSQKPHHVRCAAGHDCWPMPNNIQQGRGICFTCFHANRVDPKSAPAEAAFRARLAELGAELLEPEWLGSKSRHRVRCSEGHSCDPLPDSVKQRGSVCSRCSLANRVNPRSKPARMEFKARVEEQGGKVLSPEWLGVDMPHHCRCAIGHDCYPSLSNLRKHSLCLACVGRDSAVAWAEFKYRVEAQGGVVLESAWLGNRKPHHLLCPQGHECHPTPGSVRAGRGICFTCSGRDPVTAEKNFRVTLAELGATLLEAYHGSVEPHHVRCAEGHDCYPRPGCVQFGTGICKPCAWADQDVFYVVTGPPAIGLKFGITSGDSVSRLRDHYRNGYTSEVRVFTRLARLVASELEQQVMIPELKKAGFRPIHGTEYFGIDALDLVLRIVDKFTDQHAQIRKAA